MERKLATIRVIKSLEPIPNADLIELATVDNWKVVVAKNVGHKVGDKVVYCEIDSFLPIKPEYEFLRPSSYRKMLDVEGFALRTIKLRGQISQGLILPLGDIELENKYDIPVGTDVSEQLGIIKYEKPITPELAGDIFGYMPTFISKTDEERVQNLSNYNEIVNSGLEFYESEKLDGTSSTYFINNGEFGVCSRNLHLKPSETNTFWKAAKMLDLETKLRSLNRNIAIQGELIGEGVQKNRYNIKGHTIRFFRVFDIDQQKLLPMGEFIKLIEEMGLVTVPINKIKLPNTVEELLTYSDGPSLLNPKTLREGIVIKSEDSSISFKVISNKFLIKNEE